MRRETGGKPVPSTWVMVHFDILSNMLQTKGKKEENPIR